MGLDNLLYYVLNLITEGHKWQYQNATCTNKRPSLYFTALQFIAIILACIFVVISPTGIEHGLVDSLLSSLSIMTGFFLALIVFIYDKYMTINRDIKTDDEKIDECKNQNYLLQFNALTSYAIFISMIVIAILIGTLLFGYKINLKDYSFASSWEDVDLLLTTKLSFVVIIRFLQIYFLLDFFIISIYAVCSLFQFVNVGMNKNKLPFTINDKFVKSDKETLKLKYPNLSIVAKLIIVLLVLAMIVYFWQVLQNHIKSCFN